ncbi:hypothetical protein NMG60_11000417 [Bertholletia excelsa]
MEQRKLDPITHLPPEVMRRIVSTIPLKEAVRTSVLSTAWKKTLWSPTLPPRAIDFKKKTEEKDDTDLTRIVSYLLNPYHSLELWRFSLLNQALTYSAVRVGSELFLNLSEEKPAKNGFNLALESTRTTDYRFFPLKNLHLGSVSQQAEDLVSTLFTNCQLLERLKLEKCFWLRKIRIKSHSLVSFALVDCPNLQSIELSASSLKSFHYRGVLPEIEIKCSPRLVDVELNLRDGLGENEFDLEGILDLLFSLKDIEVLTVSGWLLEWLCKAGVIFGRLQFRFNRLKELCCWFDGLVSPEKRGSLVCFLDASPTLQKLLIKIDPNPISLTCPQFHQYWHEPHLLMDHMTERSNASQLKHLKIIKLIGFNNHEDQILLMDLLLNKALLLESLVVESPENRSWKVARIPRSQLKHTVGCLSKHIPALSPSKDHFFGFTEQNIEN